jgi:ABC-type bacteriocin/lantibiotic exporter with double-glycine peptidase domain
VCVAPFACDQRASGDLLMRLRGNSDLRETLTGEAFSLVLDRVLVVTYLAFLLWRQPVLAALTLGFGGLQIVCSGFSCPAPIWIGLPICSTPNPRRKRRPTGRGCNS